MSKLLMIESFIKDLETVIDVRYKLNRETDMCNHSHVIKLKYDEYIPAKTRLEDSLEILLTQDII